MASRKWQGAKWLDCEPRFEPDRRAEETLEVARCVGAGFSAQFHPQVPRPAIDGEFGGARPLEQQRCVELRGLGTLCGRAKQIRGVGRELLHERHETGEIAGIQAQRHISMRGGCGFDTSARLKRVTAKVADGQPLYIQPGSVAAYLRLDV